MDHNLQAWSRSGLRVWFSVNWVRKVDIDSWKTRNKGVLQKIYLNWSILWQWNISAVCKAWTVSFYFILCYVCNVTSYCDFILLCMLLLILLCWWAKDNFPLRWTIKLYYTILYYTILYYTILYYTILYYTILQVHINKLECRGKVHLFQ